MKTTKSPVYHRTSDGRKVVIVGKNYIGILAYNPLSESIYTYQETELTPWVEPETIVRYHVVLNQMSISCGFDTLLKCKDHCFRYQGLGIIKVTYTGNDFTVEKCDE